MIPLILKIALSALLFYSSFVCVYVNLIKEQFDLLSLFFSLSLCSLCFLLFWHVYQHIKTSPKENIESKSNTPPYFLALCLISLLIGFFNVHSQYSRGLHISEIGQFSAMTNNTIDYSYTQQQTPLDYYFSSFSRQIMHESKFSLRSHTMLFYLLLCLILPLGLYYYSSFLISALGSLFFLINHVTRLHCVDGRPLNLALLTGFLFLFFYISYFTQSKQKQSLIPVLCSQYLFIVSIGLQPVIFTCALFLSSFWLFFYSQKEIFKKLFLSHVIISALSFPFYFKMLLFGQSTEKFKEFSFSSIAHYFEEWSISHLVQKYFFTFYDKMCPSFFLPLLGWVLLLALTKQKPHKKTGLLLSSVILFPLLFDALFLMGIQYHYNNWYFIVFSLFLIFCFAFLCQDLDSYLKTKKYYFYILTFFLMLFTGNVYLQTQQIKNETRFYHPYRDNSVEKVYDYLKEKGSPEDFILELQLIPVLDDHTGTDIQNQNMILHKQKIHPAFFISKMIQYTKTPPFFYEWPITDIYYTNKINPNSQKIFLIQKNDIHEDNYAERVLSQFLPKKLIGYYSVFELTLSSSNKEREYIQFLHKIKEKTPKKYQNSLLETLMYYAYQKREKEKFNRLLQNYRELKNHLPEYTKNFKYPIHFDHQRRIKYFESLNWN